MQKTGNTAQIDLTACVHHSARLGSDVQIGSYSIIGAETEVGNGTVIGPHVAIGSQVRIGCADQIFSGSCIGGEPFGKVSNPGSISVIIGDQNIIREYVAIAPGIPKGKPTRLGSCNFLMISCQVGRGCCVGSQCVISNATCLEEDIVVGDLAVLSGLMGITKSVHIGTAAMLSGLSLVDRDVPPFAIASGNPARLRGLNRIGLKRCRIAAGNDGARLRRLWRLLYRSNLALVDALEQARHEPLPPACEQLCLFLEDSLGPARQGPMPSQ